MLKLYHMQESGNCYKVRLLLSLLRRPVELVPVDILKGESRTAEFLARNPNGRIPLLEFDDGRVLAESNAILYYLAQRTPLLAADPWQQAQTLQWLFFEQYSHEPYIATVRYWVALLEAESEYADAIAERRPKGYAALSVMETQLETQDFFVGRSYSIADIALYAYTHVAEEGGYDLSGYPAITAWLERISRQPHHIDIHGASIETGNVSNIGADG